MEEEYAPPGFLPKRFIMVGLLFLALFHDKYTRKALPDAMKLLAQQNAGNATASKNTDCPKLKAGKKATTSIYQDVRSINYGWTDETSSGLGNYYYASYVTGQPIFGYLADKYMCTKYLLAIAIGGSSALILLTPTIVDSTEGNVMVVKLMRFIHGIIMSMLTPSIASTIAHWVPSTERGTLLSMTYFGLNAGLVVAFTVTDTVIKAQKNWATPFYIYGGVGVVIFILWFTLASPSPDTCPSISAKEKFYLDADFGNAVDHGKKPVPLRRILLSRDVWLLLLANCGYLFMWKISVKVMPTYFSKVLKFKGASTKLWKCLPSIVMSFTTIMSGIISDWLINRGYVNKIVMRKTCANITLMGGAIYFMALSLASCQVDLVKLLFVIARGLEGINFCGIRIVVFDISPNYAALLMAFTNGLSLFPTIFIPQIMKKLAPNKNMKEFRRLFLLTLGVSTISNFLFIVFVRVKLQEWNTPETKSKKQKKALE